LLFYPPVDDPFAVEVSFFFFCHAVFSRLLAFFRICFLKFLELVSSFWVSLAWIPSMLFRPYIVIAQLDVVLPLPSFSSILRFFF